MKQYLDLLQKTIDEGVWIKNSRTGTNCLTIANHTLTYNVGKGEFPLVTTRKSYWKQAIGEMIAYIRAYTDIRDFHSLGVHTWDENVKAWWESVDKYKGANKYYCGIIYGASSKIVGVTYQDILDKIKNTPDDRGIIWNFWNPEWFDLGCLRPCMYSHQFTVLGDTLHLTSVQRSVDEPLGLNFNMVQCYFLLAITAHLTGLKAGTATHHLVNCHIYENQLELVKEQLTREPYPSPKLEGIELITEEGLFNNAFNPVNKLSVVGYQYHPPIKYPFTV